MQSTDIPQLPTSVVCLVITLCGAVILALFDIWLRQREVKDSSLLWMCLSLLSWTVSGLAQIAAPAAWLNKVAGITPNAIPYYLSPISSVLLTMTAFRLSRVREAFHAEDLRAWRFATIVFVFALSAVSCLLNILKEPLIGNTVDAVASCFALMVLGCGLTYSFYKYGNQLLAGLTVITITFLITRQFIGAAYGPLHGVLAAANVASIATLTMLFIALTVAWGLSDMSRLKPVGAPVNVRVIAAFFDLRGSTEWTSGVLNGDFCYVGDFIDELRGWIWRETSKLGCGHPKTVKFLGDGFLFVWEVPAKEVPTRRAMDIARLACALTQEYPLWAARNPELWRGVPVALGIGIDAGPAIRLTFESGAEDYIGAPLNMASRMQDLARPHGGVVVQANLWNLFDDSARQLFPKADSVECEVGKQITVYATEGVELIC